MHEKKNINKKIMMEKKNSGIYTTHTEKFTTRITKMLLKELKVVRLTFPALHKKLHT